MVFFFFHVITWIPWLSFEDKNKYKIWEIYSEVVNPTWKKRHYFIRLHLYEKLTITLSKLIKRKKKEKENEAHLNVKNKRKIKIKGKN